MRLRHVPALVLAFLAGSVLLAAADEHVLYVADFHVRPGSEKEFLDLVKKHDLPMFDKLMAEGAVLSWGVDAPLLHDPAGATHHFWWVSPNMASIGKVLAAEEELDKKIEADDAKAAKEAKAAGKPAPKKTMERFLATIDFSRHRDRMFTEQVGAFRPPAAGTLPYIFVTFGKAQPGKAADLRAAWEKHIKPTLDKLVADGTVIGYGFSLTTPRTDEFTHVSWSIVADLAGRDKQNAAFDARTEAERKEAAAAFAAALDLSASRGLVLRSLIYQVAPPKK